jgi:hypothetical protein
MKNIFARLSILFLIGLASPILFAQPHRNPVPKVAVTTYHYDFMRTGWNSHEEILNPTLSPPGPISGPFGLLKVVALDDTVYAQPLIAPDVTIAGNKHDVVYVVTENNTVFAIDAYTGTVLLTRHLGPAVPRPRGCANNGDRVGIESTPVIDLDRHAMYLMSYTVVLRRPTYLLHAIDLSTLADQVPPVTASASHKLADGSTFTFNAAAQRQRAALLLADGNIYAAFASWCDDLGIQPFSRGWLLGWHAPDLSPLPKNILVNRVSGSHLSSIWMSGSGVAAVAGHLYFTTGNSPDGSYDPHNNLSESVVKVSSDLSQTLDFYTPSDALGLNNGDEDLGSGGVLLLPNQPGAVPHMAVAAGKAGWLYLMDRRDGQLGGHSDEADNILGQYPIGSCFCAESYYNENIVTSGGVTVGVWQIYTSPSPGLTQVASASINSLGGGFFTSVSSNGNDNVIIWAVSKRHSAEGGPEPTLFAFHPVAGSSQLQQIFTSPAGNWDVPHPQGDGANSNIVPVVANGHVYVASYKQLDIFGFGPPVIKPELAIAEAVAAPSPPRPPVPESTGFSITRGTITRVQGSRFVMKTEAGKDVQVDARAAVKNGLSAELVIGRPVSVYGNPDAKGIVHATLIRRVYAPKKR